MTKLRTIFQNRTIIAVLCIILALVICFVLAPLISKAKEEKIEVYRLVEDIPAGETITENKLELAEVTKYNLPDSLLADKESVIGKIAATYLYKDDFLTSAKLLNHEIETGLQTLKTNELAISVSVKSLAAGLSGKLQTGDIVSILIPTDEGDYIIPTALTYVEVLSVTATTGKELNPDEIDYSYEQYGGASENLPATITLRAVPMQAQLLAAAENDGGLHTALVYRGDRFVADECLENQALIISSLGGDADE